MKKKVKEFGIEMSYSSLYVIKQRMDILLEMCPSGSSLKLEFDKNGSNIHGILHLRSNHLSAYISKTGLSPLECYYFLEADLKERIEQWRLMRFKPTLNSLKADAI